MLKLELDTLDGVDESVAAFYEPKGDKFRLKVDGVEDVSGLKAKINELLDEKKAAQKRAEQESEARAREAAEAAARSGDVEALTRSWQDKYDKSLAERDAAIKARDERLTALTVGATAQSIGSEIAMHGSATVVTKLIRERLRYEDGKVIVLDAEGLPSALTLDELKNEFRQDPAIAPLIQGSKASGGGAGGAKGGGAAKSWNELSGMERVELRRNNPAEHERLKRAAGK